MIITKYHISCDICHIATLEIKTMQVHNAVKEIADSGWKTIRPDSQIGEINNNPYLATHICLGCQADAAIKSHGGEN